MSKNFVLDYIHEKVKETKEKHAKKPQAPIITISREFGCPGVLLETNCKKPFRERN